MRYGHFDDAAKEYVITRPDTPASWSNYLGTTEYGAIITNNAGGYSFYKSGAQGRFMRARPLGVPADQPGRYFYLRDRATGDYWSASWQPVGKNLKHYKSTCRFGTGYAIISSLYDGIASESTYFVPRGQTFEYWLLKLTNTGKKLRKLSVFTYVEFSSEWRVYHDMVNMQYSQHIVKATYQNGIIGHHLLGNLKPDPDNFQNADQCRRTFIALAGAKVSGYETKREAFIGPYRTYANPLAVERGKCGNSLAYGDNMCGTLQADIDLAPGESKELVVMLGIGDAAVEGRAIKRTFGTWERAQAELDALKQYWHGYLGALHVRTPDKEFNSMINVWNAYNCCITFTWSRAASLVYQGERDGLGFRDTVQDFMGALPLMPEAVGQRLELMLTGQLANGGAMPVVKPFAHRPGHEQPPPEHAYRSDDCLWVFFAVPEYVKETGRLEFYDKVLPYADHGEATVLQHLRRALEFNLERRGAHGLPCGLDADWNDCLRLGYRGESVFVAFQLRYGLLVYAEICRRLHREDEARWADEQRAAVDAAIQQHTWDGKWFVRAFREDGSVIGAHTEKEGAIYLNAQAWAVISGAATPEQAAAAMKSVQQRLATRYGIMLCAPPYRTTPHHVVRAVLFNEGTKENAGIFSQPQPWAVMAECLLGNTDRAYQYYRAFMPAAYNDHAEVRQIEPYVHCQFTHSKYSKQFGVSRTPWLTGTASWAYYAATHSILGIQPDYDGLRLQPCLPRTWKEVRVRRMFRGKQFDITLLRGRRGAGAALVILNGRQLDGNLIPCELFEERNDVTVVTD